MSVTVTSVVPGNQQLTISWTSGGLYGFNVYYGTSNPLTFAGWTINKTYTVTGLTNGTTYNLEVVELDDYGEETTYHDHGTFQIVPATVTWSSSLTVTPGICENVLTWTNQPAVEEL